MKWKLLILFSIIVWSCKRNHECYVQNSEGVTLDTIPCKCYKDVIKELEASPYDADTAIYEVNCN